LKLPKKPSGQNDVKEASWTVEGDSDGQSLLMELSIVIDMHEQIVVWFLPYALSRERQVRAHSYNNLLISLG
jgi:hypothetical protein